MTVACSRWSIWCSIHETSYRDIQQFIEKPPGKLRIFEIYPPKPLHSIALGSRIPALREDYKLGRLCGRYFLATVGKLLTEKAPLTRHLVPVVTPESIVIPPAPVANDTLVAEVSDAPQANDPTLTMRIWLDLPFYRYPLPF